MKTGKEIRGTVRHDHFQLIGVQKERIKKTEGRTLSRKQSGKFPQTEV